MADLTQSLNNTSLNPVAKALPDQDFLAAVQAGTNATTDAINSIGNAGMAKANALPTVTAPVIQPAQVKNSGIDWQSDPASKEAIASFQNYESTSPTNTGGGYAGPAGLEGNAAPYLDPNAQYGQAAPAPTPPPTWWDSAKSMLSAPLSTIAEGIGYAFHGVGSAALEAGNILTSPITAAIKTADPTNYGNNGFLGNLYDSFMQGNQEIGKYFQGGSGSGIYSQAAQGINQLAGSSVIKDEGAVHHVLGTLDFLGDPANLVTLGEGSGVKLALKTGEEFTLAEKGTQVFKDLSASIVKDMEASDAVEGLSKEQIISQANEAAQEQLGNAIKNGENITIAGRSVDASTLVDQGGLKFGGKTIPGTPGIINPTQAAISEGIKTIVQNTPGLKQAADLLREGFQSSLSKIDNAYVRNIIQRVQGEANGLKNNAFKTVEKLTGGLSQEELMGILYGRGNAEIQSSLSQKAQDVAKKVYDFMDRQLAAEKASGMPITQIDNYMPQMWKEDGAVIGSKMDAYKEALAEKVKSGAELTQGEKDLQQFYENGGAKNVNPKQPFFTNDRSLTQAAGQTLGLTPQDDFYKVMQARLSYGIDNIAKNNLTSQLVDKFGNKIADQGAADAVTQDTKDIPNPVTIKMADGTKAVIPSDINDAIASVTGKSSWDTSSLPPMVQNMIRGYDNYVRSFKFLVTQVEPAFFARHGMDGLFRNVMDLGIYPLLRPDSFVHSIILGNPALTKAFADRVISYGGHDLSIGELSAMLEKMGVTNTGGVAAEGIGTNGLRQTSQAIENASRVQSFLLNFDKTGSIDTALAHLRKFQFDYQNMTPFENSVMKRIFPFYSFRKNNMVFQLSQLTNPKMLAYYRAIKNQWDASGVNPKDYPDYASNGKLSIPTKNSDGSVTFTKLGLSPEEADQVLRAVSSKDAFRSYIADQAAPPLKMAGEMLTKTNFFTGASFDTPKGQDASQQSVLLQALNRVAPGLVGYQKNQVLNKQTGQTTTQETANPYVESLVGSLPTSRITSSISEAVGDKGGAKKTADLTTPFRQYNFTTTQQDNNKFFNAKGSAKDELSRLTSLGYIKQSSTGKYYVNNNISVPNDPLKTSQLRNEASRAISNYISPGK